MTGTTPDVPDVPPPREHLEQRLPTWAYWAGVGVLVVGLAGGFLIGRGTKSSGPSSLADAIKQTESGSLPRGDITGVLQGGGGVRAILGGGGAGGAGGSGTGGGVNGRGGFGGVAGTVSAVNGDQIRLTTTSGTVTVLVSGSTTYSKTAAATLAEVTPGERVTVRADLSTPSSGGQVNAGSVIIDPAGATTGAGAASGTGA